MVLCVPNMKWYPVHSMYSHRPSAHRCWLKQQRLLRAAGRAHTQGPLQLQRSLRGLGQAERRWALIQENTATPSVRLEFVYPYFLINLIIIWRRRQEENLCIHRGHSKIMFLLSLKVYKKSRKALTLGIQKFNLLWAINMVCGNNFSSVHL